MEKGGFLYILTNNYNTTIYVGITSDLITRMHQHKNKVSARYNLQKLVYWEGFHHMADAVAREKQIKGGSRKRKIELIEALNPNWNDLTEEILIW